MTIAAYNVIIDYLLLIVNYGGFTMLHLDTLLLKTISGSEMYGHQIIAELDRKSNGYFKIKTGTIYPLLQSLENRKLLVSHTAQHLGRERKFYKITAAGDKYLNSEMLKWQEYANAVNCIFEK